MENLKQLYQVKENISTIIALMETNFKTEEAEILEQNFLINKGEQNKR